MKVLPARLNEGGLLSLALVKMTPGLEDFLLNNPFVAIDRDGRYRVTGFVRDLDEKGRSQIGEWRRQYCAGSHIGLNVFILAPGEFPSLINGSAPESCEGGSRSGNRPRG